MKRIATVAPIGLLVCAGMLGVGCNRANNTVAPVSDIDAATVNAVGTSGSGEPGETKADRDARRFVLDMVADGTGEVQAARLAEEKAQSQEVKQFAQMMERDHTKAGEELNKIAAMMKVQGPTDLGDDHTKLMGKLARLQGADFDREYMKAMVDHHEEAVDSLQKHAHEPMFGHDKTVTPKKADDSFEAWVNQWAADTLPVVRQHLDRAKEVKDHVGGGLVSSLKNTVKGNKRSASQQQ